MVLTARGLAAVLVALGGLPTALAAQTGGVEGRVRDDEGPPVFSASVLLTLDDGSEVVRFTETDRLGYYRLEDVPPGRYELHVQRIGYAVSVQPIDIIAERRLEIDVTLTTQAIEVEGISVDAERSREQRRFREDAGATVREISGEDLRFIPGLAEADPIRAIEVLPGVISTSDFTSAFNVRGGSADQNLILLDGVPIFNPFHLGGLFSVFNADMVGRAELQSGGFPAEYGGRVSSVLLVESDPGTEDFSVQGGVSLLATRIALGGGISDGLPDALGLQRVHWRASARRSYFDQVLKPVLDFPYHLTDIQGLVEGWTKGGSRISLTAYTGTDVLNLTTLDEEDFPVRVFWDWGNDVFGGRWTIPQRGGGALEFRAGYTRFGTGLKFPDFDDSEFASRISQVSLGTDLERSAGRRWTFKGGLSADRMGYDNVARSGGTEFGQGDGTGWLMGAYTQTEWRGGTDWLAEAGVRADRWLPSAGKNVDQIAPRLALKRFFRDGDAAIKVAAGRFTQFLHSLRDEELPLGLDVWVLTGDRAPHVSSDQLQVGIESYFGDRWFASLEAYTREFDGVATNNLADDPNTPSDDLLPGTGRSRGVDLFIRRSAGSVTGWLSASYLRATRTFPDFVGGLDPPPDLTYPPIFDRRVDVDLVLRFPLPRGISAGIRWNLGTGLPFTRPLGTFAYFTPRHTSGSRLVWQGDGVEDEAYAVVLGPRNGERYPTYHRLDFSVRKTFVKGWGTLTPYVDVLNLYNRRNVLFYFFEYDLTPPTRSGVSMFPILPTLGVELTF